MQELPDFESYLKGKKIDPVLFRQDDPVLWKEWAGIYEQIHPDSFTAQKLFLINRIRRKYPLTDMGKTNQPAALKMSKPKMIIKPPNQ